MSKIEYDDDTKRCRVCGVPHSRTSGDLTFKTQDTYFEYRQAGDFRERELVGKAERFWLCPSCARRYLRMRSSNDISDLTEWALSVIDSMNPIAGKALRKRLAEGQKT